MKSQTQKTTDFSQDSQDSLLARQSAGAIRRFVFPAGTLLFKKGESRQCAYLIDKGQVHIFGNDEGGEEKLLCALGAGEIFGETALVDGTPRTATAVTVTEAEIFVIPRDSLRARLRDMDPIVSLLITLLIERYRITRIHLPESVKQDTLGDFIDKISKYEQLPEDMLRARDLSDQREKALQEMKLEQELRTALEKRQFVPFLQPIIDLRTRNVAGYEALVRWQHPEQGLLAPDQFIPVAERTDLVREIDRLMLDMACGYLAALGDKKEILYISVNLSGTHFASPDIVGVVARILERHKIDPRHIHFEITESALIHNPQKAHDILQKFRDMGIHIALDDFGTGYSSLGYLHDFAIDSLKIDRSFVSRIRDGNRSRDIVCAVIALAKSFGLDVVAEGIESDADADLLQTLECGYGQGYLFGRPAPVEEVFGV